MRFQVPQFIETETRIIGPFSLKQFGFIAAGAILIFILRYIFSNLMIWIAVSLPIGGLAVALAFVKIDGVPLSKYVSLAISFMAGGKSFTFKPDWRGENKAGEKLPDNYEKYLNNNG